LLRAKKVGKPNINVFACLPCKKVRMIYTRLEQRTWSKESVRFNLPAGKGGLKRMIYMHETVLKYLEYKRF